MDTTVVITPRERFSLLPSTLRAVFAHTPRDVPVIVIDAGAPPEIRQELRGLQSTRRFTHIESETFLLPPRVRNMALDMVETKYVCYLDNDALPGEDWLNELENCAERTGAGAVCPVTLFGPLPEQPIHHAGSILSVRTGRTGRRLLSSHHRLEWEPLEKMTATNWAGLSMEHDEFEYHCVLIRTDCLRAIGGHDERQTHHDHINDSLRLRLHGCKIMLEPKALVTYCALRPFSNEDWRYFLFRWSVRNTVVSESHLGEVWGVRKNPVRRQFKFLKMHRRRAAATTLPTWVKKLKPKLLRQPFVEYQHWRISQLDPKVPAPSTVHVPPAVPADGLKRAGIRGA